MSWFAIVALFGMPVIALLVGLAMVYMTDPKRTKGRW
jgi:hypothetical protein